MMPEDRTYALFDLIGVREGLDAGTASKALRDFWNVCEDWANHQIDNLVPLHLADGATSSPTPRLVTYSDSAFFKHDPQLSLTEFFRLVDDLKQKIEKRAGHCYVVVAHGAEIEHEPPNIYVKSAGEQEWRYTNVFGSGDVVVNLWEAEKVVRRTKDWHDKYSTFYVGHVAPPRKVLDERDIPGGKYRVKALG